MFSRPTKITDAMFKTVLRYDKEEKLWVVSVSFLGQTVKHDFACDISGNRISGNGSISCFEATDYVARTLHECRMDVQKEADTIKLVTRCGCSREVIYRGDCWVFRVPLLEYGMYQKMFDGSALPTEVQPRIDREFEWQGKYEGKYGLMRIYKEKSVG